MSKKRKDEKIAVVIDGTDIIQVRMPEYRRVEIGQTTTVIIESRRFWAISLREDNGGSMDSVS